MNVLYVCSCDCVYVGLCVFGDRLAACEIAIVSFQAVRDRTPVIPDSNGIKKKKVKGYMCDVYSI